MITIVLMFVVALSAQYTISQIDLRSWLASLTVEDRAPVHMPAARTEREINRQQQYSAELLTEISTDPDVPAVQPDAVRLQSTSGIKADLIMRCGEKLPPESVWTTSGVEIHVRSAYQGVRGDEHHWKYTVAFKNTGVNTVQMLTRQWVFIDSSGKAEEVKGPGARGVTPVLSPGDSWSYESGTSLPTSTGSMYGSFQFDTLVAVRPVHPLAFSAPVARLALSITDRGEISPCAAEPIGGTLGHSSVRATRRVIVGANARYVEHMSSPAEGLFRFAYDVQINNARPHAVRTCQAPHLRAPQTSSCPRFAHSCSCGMCMHAGTPNRRPPIVHRRRCALQDTGGSCRPRARRTPASERPSQG